MKKILATVLAAAAVLPATAGDMFDAGDENRPYFGVRVSFEAPIPGKINASADNASIGVSAFKTGAGFDAGAIYNIPLWKNLYFEPGLSLFYNAFGVKDDMFADEPDIASVKASVRTFGFRIPFSFGYRFDLAPCSLYAFTGPELEVGLVGREHISGTIMGEKVSESESIYGNGYRRYDISWKFGVGVSVDNYYLGLSGNVGMVNRISDDSEFGGVDVSYHQNLFQLTLGYNF